MSATMKRKAGPNDILIEQILDEALEDLLREIEHIAKSEDRKEAVRNRKARRSNK
tara:strand:- start:717 stop:881 length:165 start_codon:yes stop_codon:yes gene_type:complete